MKQVLLIGSCLLSLYVPAQPNLTASYISNPPTIVNRGDYLSFSFKIKNIGATTATKSHTGIYISNSTSFNNAVLLTEICTEVLSPGSETQLINFIFPLPYNYNPGNDYIMLLPDNRHEVIGNTNTSAYFNPNTFNISSISIGGKQNLPYPLILIHGYTGSDSTWEEFKNDLESIYGFTYGGNMNFCLNQDQNLYTSNKNLDYHDWTIMSELKKGDFYTVNFNTDNNGTKLPKNDHDFESNQAGALKQGLAIRDAIKHVIEITGKAKVILLGHSMGGLAAREYLQNLTQIDNQHHVAKLATIGTPHGGSNLTGFGLGIFAGFDEESEAVRDLKTSYLVSAADGVYLFGGQENYSVMNNSLLFDYNNVDVNCNGIDADNSTIVGLNQKSIPNDLNFSCGIGTALGDDGVVSTYSANLNNFYNIFADTFRVNLTHLSEPENTEILLKLIDEPYIYDKSYNVGTDTFYFGSFTRQSITAPYQIDYDDYKFSVLNSQMVNLKLYDIPLSDFRADILDNSYNPVYAFVANGKGFLDLNFPMNAGSYFLEISGTPDNTVWKNPYAYKLSLTGNGSCPQSNTVIASGITGTTYQWQVDTGTGFTNISNSSVYSGANSYYLILNQPPTNWYGNKYHCIVNGSILSTETVLRFTSRWLGTVSNAWENPANWNCGILPDSNTDVVVNSDVPNFPRVNSNQSCRGILINPTAQVFIKSGANLIITGR